MKPARPPFEFALPTRLIGLPQDGGHGRFTVNVRVTDSAGQDESTTVSRIVTASPLGIEIIAESGQLVRDVANTVYLLTTYADGQPARTRIAIAGKPDGVETDEQGLAAIEVVPNADQVSIVASASDRNGLSTNRTQTLTCGKMRDDYLLRLDRAVYAGGQTARISVFGGGQ